MLVLAIFILGGVFAAFTIFVAVMRIVRRMRARAVAAPLPPAFDLAEVRALLDQGKITQAENDRLRDLVLKQSEEYARARPPKARGPRGFEVGPVNPPADP